MAVNRKNSDAFGIVLRAYRQEKGLTQEQLSERVDVVRSFICTLESGKKQPSLEMVLRLEAISKTPQEEDDTSELHHCEEVFCMKFIPYNNSPEILQPSEKPFHFPTAAVPPQGSSILCVASLFSVWGNHFNAPVLFQFSIKLVAIVSLIADKARRQFVGKAFFQRCFDQGHFMRRRACHVNGERKTSSVCHCHDLGALAALCFTNGTAPFFAGAKVPSIKASRKSSLPRSRRSSAKAKSTASKTPSFLQRWNHLWHVWYGGYRAGRSFQCAPVLRIQSIPFKTARGSLAGLPCPSGPFCGSGSNPDKRSHCSFVMSMPNYWAKLNQKSRYFLEKKPATSFKYRKTF